jgi:hypothetical protein
MGTACTGPHASKAVTINDAPYGFICDLGFDSPVTPVGHSVSGGRSQLYRQEVRRCFTDSLGAGVAPATNGGFASQTSAINASRIQPVSQK